MNSWLERVEVAQLCAERFRGRPLDFVTHDCVRMARFVLRLRGHKTGLLKGVRWSSERGAYKAMRRLGFSDLREGMDRTGLLAIPFAMARPADIVALPADNPFGCSLSVYIGDRTVIGYQDGHDVGVSIALAPDFEPLKVWMV